MEKFGLFLTTVFVFNVAMMTLWYFSNSKIKEIETCSFSDFLTSVSDFSETNGLRTFKDVLKQKCRNVSFLPQIQKTEDLIRTKIKDCRRRFSFGATYSHDEDIPLLTMSTSWMPTPGKYFVHNSTLRNWSSFIPKVNLVLFTNDTALRKEVKQYGWTVFDITHHVDGVPVLREMFKKVMSSFNSTFYGYSNSDILFTDNLITSLQKVSSRYSNKNLFLTGRRTNIPFMSLKEVVSYDNIRQAASLRGELFVISSEDYFITTSHFHWSKVPPLIIGRPAYDNWLVGYARCNFYTVIDMTDTVLACHQTTKSGNKEGHSHQTLTRYNHELLKKLGLGTNYDTGFIVCPKLKSYYTLCGDIDISEKFQHQIPAYCSCKFW